MGQLLVTLAAAVGVFAGTNVDDVVVLTVLFVAGRATGRPRRWEIWTGQYAGIALLVAASAAAAAGLAIVPNRWAGLLGLIPFWLGVRGLISAFRSGAADDDPPPVAGGLLAVLGLTIANGADNLSVYIPMFRMIGIARSIVTVAAFAVLVAVTCAAGSLLASNRRIIEVIERYGRWIVPIVFMIIGAVIVGEFASAQA